MAYKHCYAAIGVRRHFPRKLVWIVDEWHPHGGWSDETPAPDNSYTRATWPPRGRGRGESLTSPRRIEAKLRAAEAVRLRIAGYSFQAIANRLGFGNRCSAWCAVRRTFDRFDRERSSTWAR